MPVPPSTIALWLSGTTVLFAVCFGGLAHRFARSENAADRHSRLVPLSVIVVALIEVFALTVLGIDDLVADQFADVAGVMADGIVAMFVGNTTLFAAAAVPVLVTYSAMLPALRSARELDLSLLGNVVRVSQATVVFAFCFGGLMTLFSVVSSGGSDGVVLGSGVVITLTGYVVAPYLTRLTAATRLATGAERTRVQRACDDVDLDPLRVWVVEDAGEERATLHLTGAWGRRHLFVSDYLLDTAADEQLTALVAMKAGRARAGLIEAKFILSAGIVVLALGVATGALAPLGAVLGLGQLGGFVLGCVVLYGSMWVVGRRVFQADEDAVARTSRDAVLGTMEWLVDDDLVTSDPGRLLTAMSMTRSFDERMERLRKASDSVATGSS